MRIPIKLMSKMKYFWQSTYALNRLPCSTSGAGKLFLAVPLVPLMLELILVVLLGFYVRKDKMWVSRFKYRIKLAPAKFELGVTSDGHQNLNQKLKK